MKISKTAVRFFPIILFTQVDQRDYELKIFYKSWKWVWFSVHPYGQMWQ